MIIAGSLWRKALVTVIAAGGFVSLYEVTMLDSQNMPWLRPSVPQPMPPPAPGARLTFSATAYCKGLVTSAGVAAQTGVAASDPSLLPIGSVVDIDAHDPKYNGIYSILDTGPAIQGRALDIYMWSCHEALRFGRRPVRLTIIRLGWSPGATATSSSFLDRLFKRPELPPGRPLLPARPLPIIPGTSTAESGSGT